MFNDLKPIDKMFVELEQEFDFWPFLEPINADSEKTIFLERLNQGKPKDPIFEYDQPPFTEKALKKIDECRRRLDLVSSPLNYVYEELLEYLFETVRIILADRNSPEFLSGIVNLFGLPEQSVLDYAEDILASFKPTREASLNTSDVSDQEVAKHMGEMLRKFGFNWKIEVSDQISSRISINPVKKTLRVKKNSFFSKADLTRFWVHEIQTHVFRYENGMRQPLRVFAQGFDNYLPTEEGLAVLMEERANVLKAETLRLYAGRAIAAFDAPSSNFVQIFMKLRQYFDENMAYAITQRVKRGLVNTALPGGLTKDHIYLTGYHQLRYYASSGGDLPILFMGKMRLSDINLMKKLINLGHLSNPYFLPELI